LIQRLLQIQRHWHYARTQEKYTLTFSERGMPIMRSNAYHCSLRVLAFTRMFGGGAWAADDIKLGMLYPLTGIYAAPGK
jgi:hypothetical protein